MIYENSTSSMSSMEDYHFSITVKQQANCLAKYIIKSPIPTKKVQGRFVHLNPQIANCKIFLTEEICVITTILGVDIVFNFDDVYRYIKQQVDVDIRFFNLVKIIKEMTTEGRFEIVSTSLLHPRGE